MMPEEQLMRRILRHSRDGQYFCPICKEPVKLETAKTNEHGDPIHDECYLANVSRKISPATPRKAPFPRS